MKIEKTALPNLNRLIRGYKNHDTYIMDYFDYEPFADFTAQRIADLRERSFNRQQLANVLAEANSAWGAPESTMDNIERLRADHAVAVIGGQQAGLLTGPLYSVNKLISIIQLARSEEKRLGIPVVPVFWIAGEDHDFDEINHVFMPKDGRMEKIKLNQYPEKRSVSMIKNDRVNSKAWLDTVFAELSETEWTRELYEVYCEKLENSDSYVDFFAKLIFEIFKDEGVILLDSGSKQIRQLESGYFTEMIKEREQIAGAVARAQKELSNAGYHVPLEPAESDGNLFLDHQEERVLLHVDEAGNWAGKQNEVLLSTVEMLEIAQTAPERLSNNVITRPLMQELLIPTLAFIGGNGEIAYWSALKEAFHALDLKMPPVLPRLSFTYVNKRTEKKLGKLNLQADKAITEGTAKTRMSWLQSQMTPPLDLMRDELKRTIAKAHEPLKESAIAIGQDIGQLAKENLRIMEREIDYLHKRMIQALEKRNEGTLSSFDELEMMLSPFGGLQERVWNPLYFLNSQGTGFITALSREQLSFETDHYIVHI